MLVVLLLWSWVWPVPLHADAGVEVQTGRAANDKGVMAVSLAAQLVATSNAVGHIQVWNLARRQRLARLDSGAVPLQSLSFVLGGRALLLKTADSVRVWNLATNEVTLLVKRAPAADSTGQSLPTPADSVVDLAMTEDGSTLAAGQINKYGVTYVRRTRAGKETMFYMPPSHLAFSNTGRYLAGIAWGKLTVVDTKLSTGGEPVVNRLPIGASNVLAPPRFDGQEKRVLVWVTGGGDGSNGRLVWIDLESGVRRDVANASSADFHSDGRILYLDADGCTHLRTWPDADVLSPVPCRSDGGQLRQFAVVSNDLLFNAGALFEPNSGRRVGLLSSRAVVQRVKSFDAASGRIEMETTLPFLSSVEANAWLLTDVLPEPPAPFHWNLATGQREPVIWSETAASTAKVGCNADESAVAHEIADGKPRLVFAGGDDQRYRIDLEGLSVCETKTGAWQPVFKRPAGIADEPYGVATFARVLPLDGRLHAVVVDHQQRLETWRLPQGELVRRTSMATAETRVYRWETLQVEVAATLRVLELCGVGPELWIALPGGVVGLSGPTHRVVFQAPLTAASCDAGRDQLLVMGPRGLDFVRQEKHGGIVHLATGDETLDTAVQGPKDRIYATSTAGGLWIVDLVGRRVVSTLYAIGDEGAIVMAPDGHYMATRSAVSTLTRRVGGRLEGSEQFDLELNRPGQVLQLLGHSRQEDVAALDRLVQLRKERRGANPPSLGAVLSWIPPPLLSQSRRITLSVEAKERQSGQLLVYVNGVPQGAGSLVMSGTSASVAVDLGAGDNLIEVKLAAADGKSQSNTLRTHVFADIAIAKKPKTWFIGVGVSDYRSDNSDLQYAAKDVRDVGQALGDVLGSRFDSRILTDSRATRAAILGLDQFLAQSAVDDRIILYFAGHGLLGSDQQYYFAPHDMDFGKPEKYGIAYAQIDRLLRLAPARNRLVFIDSCHSGESVPTRSAALPAKPVKAKVGTEPSDGPPLIRGAEPVQDLPLAATAIDQRLLEDLFLDLRDASGADVIAAAGSAEFALESSNWQNGLFTYVLRAALQSKKADLDGSGTIDANELRRYMSRTVSEMANGRQVPTARVENPIASAPVLQARPADRLATLTPPGQQRMDTDDIGEIRFSGRSHRLIALGPAGVRRYDPESLAFVDALAVGHPWRAPGMGPAAVDFQGDVVAQITQDDELWVADFKRGTAQSLGKAGPGRHGLSAKVAISSDGQLLAASVHCKGLVFWRLTDSIPTPVTVELPGCEEVDALQFRPGGQVVVVYEDASVVVVDPAKGVVGSWQIPHPTGDGFVFNPMRTGFSGSLGAAGRYYARVFVERYQQKDSYERLRDSMGWSDVDKEWNAQARVGIWDLRDKKLVGTLAAEFYSRLSIAAAAPRLLIARGTVRIVDMPSLRERAWLDGKARGRFSMATSELSANGLKSVTAGRYGHAAVWQLAAPY